MLGRFDWGRSVGAVLLGRFMNRPNINLDNHIIADLIMERQPHLRLPP